MGIFDVFKKKQPSVSFDIPPPPLDIPPHEAPAEFAGNTATTTATDAKQKQAPPQAPSAQSFPASDIEGKISAAALPPLPELPELPPELTPETPSSVSASDSDLPLLDDIPFPESLPEFPEIPSEPASPALSEAELLGPVPHPEDLNIPLELPPISSEELAWPSPVGPASSALPVRSFVFVPSSLFKDLLASVDDIKEQARSSAKSDALTTFKNKEDSLLNQLQGSLESVQRKLLYVDTALFEKAEA